MKDPDDNIDNVMKAHSLRPHTLAGHMKLYKAVLHNSNNMLDKWYLETIGLCVSMINKCSYCVEHHFRGLERLLKNDKLSAQKIKENLASDSIEEILERRHVSGLVYAEKLSQSPPKSGQSDIKKLKEAGFTDGQILEINQVVSYFNYANRTVLGLGINAKGDILGLSPNESDDPDDWGHK